MEQSHKEKIVLQFVEKENRHRPTLPPLESLDNSAQDRLLSTGAEFSCYGEPAALNSNGPCFGIGELLEEFAALSTYTPPPTPASATSSTTLSITNACCNGARSDSQSSADSVTRPISVHIPNVSPPSSVTSSSLAAFAFANANFASGRNPSAFGSEVGASLSSLNTSMSHDDSLLKSRSDSGSSVVSLSRSSSMQSSSGRGSVSTQNGPSNVLPRARRRSPMCRFCYERYARMCLDSRQPIPATYDRGMWHGHNMKERGLVTCPHLWATSCSHCGATKQYAHTDDFCPLKRRPTSSVCRTLPHAA